MRTRVIPPLPDRSGDRRQAIVVVRDQCGALTADRPPGGGTELSFTVPLAPSDA